MTTIKVLLCILAALAIGLFCRKAAAANDFSGDPNLVGLWSFEAGQTPDYLADYTDNSNDLTGSGDDPNTSIYKEGSQSVIFGDADTSNAQRLDANLSSDFPGKSGTSNTSISIVAWVRASQIHENHCIVSKWDSNKYSYGLYIALSGSYYLDWYIGYNSGNSFTNYHWTTGPAITAGSWYHVGVTYDASTQEYQMRCWDEDASTAYTATGDFGQTMSVDSARFVVGNFAGLSQGWDGYMDEVGVFDDVLTIDEIDQIRGGTFGATASGAQIMSVTFN